MQVYGVGYENVATERKHVRRKPREGGSINIITRTDKQDLKWKGDRNQAWSGARALTICHTQPACMRRQLRLRLLASLRLHPAVWWRD